MAATDSAKRQFGAGGTNSQRMMTASKTVLRLGEKLGAGGYSIVYSATERESGRITALKKSRVSLRVKRTLLKHEARVLRYLSGHPSIPEVFAYGRIKHFEFLSMQLLHRSLGDIIDEEGPLSLATVLGLADQLLASLDHIHHRGIVHRDLEPDNILLVNPGSWRVCIIDFGISRGLQKTDIAKSSLPDDSEALASVFGTLPYASINAHQGMYLTYRDDLESLAYTLIALVRNGLPWSPYTQHATVRGRIRQVYEQKKRYSGEKLALALPKEFGMLVDYSRSLSVEEMPDYGELQRNFKHCAMKTVDEATTTAQPAHPRIEPFSQPPIPVTVGQIVLAQLLSATTVEGYSAQAGHENSFIYDPTFELPEWAAPPRPALVIDVGWDERARLYHFTAVAIGQPRAAGAKADDIPIFVEPKWPLDDLYCYAFKRPAVFYCLPSQDPVSATYKADVASVDLVKTRLIIRRDPFQRASDSYQDLKSSDPDVRHDARMRTSAVQFYVELSALDQAQVKQYCAGSRDRAWFDECVKAARRRDLNDGCWWTGAAFGNGRDNGDVKELSDSYRGKDYEDWERQQERDKSLTLGMGLEGEEQGVVAGAIDEIVAVEYQSRRM